MLPIRPSRRGDSAIRRHRLRPEGRGRTLPDQFGPSWRAATTMPSADFCARTPLLSKRRARRWRRARSTDLPE